MTETRGTPSSSLRCWTANLMVEEVGLMGKRQEWRSEIIGCHFSLTSAALQTIYCKLLTSFLFYFKKCHFNTYSALSI